MSAPSAMAGPHARTTKDYPILKKLKDEELLVRFFKSNEEGAFAVLVERYGTLVYGICKRILGNAADAEDAFQATFLVLVKKGAQLQKPGRLANWLYGVAFRTANNVKSKRAQRSRVEREAKPVPAKSEISDMTYEQMYGVLNEEIHQLPPKYALPLVLCYLEGKTNAEAATQLGWPEGSMSRRLSRAKDLLRSRLSKRGMAMTAVLLAAAVFAPPASAAAPAQLLASTVEAGSLVAQGARLSDVVSPLVAKVAEDVAMSLTTTYKLAAALLLAAASLMMASSVVVYQVAGPDIAKVFSPVSPPAPGASAPVKPESSVSISIAAPPGYIQRTKGAITPMAPRIESATKGIASPMNKTP